MKKMTETKVSKLILSLSVPTIISMLISAIYNMADTYFVSKLGDSESAAISVVFSLQTLIQTFGFTIGMGSGSMISRELGDKNEKKASVYASQGILMAFILGMALLIFVLIFNDGIMKLLGASATSKPFAISYSKWIFIATPFMMMSFVMNNILRSEGKAKFSMIGISLGSILNIGLDPLFINTFDMGIEGAGLATMICQIISFLTLLSFFVFKVSISRLNPKYISRDPKTYLEVLRCGSPTLFRQGFSTTSNTILSFLGKGYGDYCVAALGITAKLYMFIRNIVVGIGQAYMPVVGYNYGARKVDRIKRAFCFTLAFQTIGCLIATIMVLVFPKELVSFFRNTKEVVEIGTKSTRMLAIALPFLGFSTVLNQSLQVLGYAKSASLLAFLRQGLVFTPVIFILNIKLKETGICLTQPLSDLITAMISIPFLFYFFKELNKIKVEDDKLFI